MATVAFRHIDKIYPDGYHAVHDLNLEIGDGEFVVLVGPSGCGKSTTLRMLAGLEEISGGDVLIGDRRVNDVEPGQRDIAMVFQNYALYPHMSVRQNLGFGLKMRRTPKAEIQQRVTAVAETLGITSLLDKRPREMSGGQRQRVALGRAIVRDPQVFLFDEPLSNLDAKLRVQMRAEIASLHRRLKTTMIYVTHDQVEAMTLGERIVIHCGTAAHSGILALSCVLIGHIRCTRPCPNAPPFAAQSRHPNARIVTVLGLSPSNPNAFPPVRLHPQSTVRRPIRQTVPATKPFWPMSILRF